MNRKERLTRLYYNKEVDRPAVYSRTAFPGGDPSYDKLKDYLSEKTELKFHWHCRQEENYDTESFVEEYSEDFERHISILHTPKGDLRSTTLVSFKGQPGLHEEYLLKDDEDIEKYLSLPMPEISGEAASFKKLETEVDDAGIVEIGLGMNPAGFVVELFGSESFAMMSLTSRELIYELCERQTKIMKRKIRFCQDNKLGPFYGMLGEEYLVPPLHGPKDFMDFNVKFDKELIDMIHDENGRIHVHSHGSIKKVFDGFLKMGVDVLHPFESPPSGDISAKEAKAASCGKICLEGNIQVAHMYEHTAEQIRIETFQLISDCFDDHKGLIVSVTASPYIRGKGEECFPQYKAMIDTVLAFGN